MITVELYTFIVGWVTTITRFQSHGKFDAQTVMNGIFSGPFSNN